MNPIEKFKKNIEEANLWEGPLELSRGEHLSVNGKINTNVYFIEKGSLRIYFEDDYEEQIIRLGYQNNFIVALDSFISEKPSDLYIQAIKKTRLLFVSKKNFNDLIYSNEEYMYAWQAMQSQLIYEQLEREKDILTHSPYKRYQRVLKRSPQLFQEIPNKYIASYLRMAPETLSRLKKS